MDRDELVAYLNEYLHIETFEDASNNGLQVEGGDEVDRLALAVDASLASIEGTIAAQAQMLLVHHGLFWGQPILVTGPHRRRLERLLAAGVSLYAAHLPLDCHPQVGNNATLARWLGPVHTVLKNKYYIDELYHLVFIRPTIWLAGAVFRWFDRGLIDGILHGIARLGELLGVVNKWVHTYVIDGGLVDGSAKVVGATGRELRQVLQTGQVQHYLLQVLMFLCAFALLYILFF